MLCDATKAGWPVVYVSTQFLRLLGLPASNVVGRGLWQVFEDPGASSICPSTAVPAPLPQAGLAVACCMILYVHAAMRR